MNTREARPKSRAIVVPVPCTVCDRQSMNEHVHTPLPCVNGRPGAHHPYTPPSSVTLLIAGQRHRVRLDRAAAITEETP